MAQYNLKNQQDIDQNYQNGLLPQRNAPDTFYSDTSSRTRLDNLELSSENRRILRKTDQFSFRRLPLTQFDFTPSVQKQIKNWVKILGWNFPVSSIRTIFTSHIFNYVYLWSDASDRTVAYAICYFSPQISHIAYVFYDPAFSHGDLPIRLTLQAVIDSHRLGLKYCYLGRFSPPLGYYKRNMPGFEYFEKGSWIPYNSSNGT